MRRSLFETARFKTKRILLWPIYVNFPLEEFKRQEKAYALKAQEAADRALIVNALSDEPKSYGNAFYVEKDEIKKSLGYEREDDLKVEVVKKAFIYWHL